MYTERFYRGWVDNKDLVSFRVSQKETDLYICAERDLSKEALESVREFRAQIESYIEKHPEFKTTLVPIAVDEDAPDIVKDMAEAARKAGVGPMAAVAGAIAEFTGKELLKYSGQVIIENGGDIFIKSDKDITIGIFAANSPFTKKINILLRASQTPIGVCTSSGTVGPSLSFGKADAATILAASASLSDAVATQAGNIVKEACDIQKAIDYARAIDGVKGVLIVKGRDMGLWGQIELV